MSKERILLIDDQPSAAEASLLALSHFVPREQILYVSSAAKAMDALNTRTFSLAFLDIDMPDTSGFSLGFLKDKETIVDLTFAAQPMDGTGTLVELDEPDDPVEGGAWCSILPMCVPGITRSGSAGGCSSWSR